MRFAVLLAPALALASPALAQATDPDTIPPAIRAMLDAAIASGNDAEVATIVKYARAADPASGDAVLAIATAWRNTQAKSREVRIEQAGTFDLWTGKVEFGGYLTTGNSDTFGLTGIGDATREGLRWRHKLYVQGDYAEALDVKTREHLLASYSPNYKVSDRHYIYGTGQFESDRFLGYLQRYTTSVGGGIGAIRTATMTLNLELGPAFRNTRFTDGRVESSLASRGLIDFDWKLTPAITLTQDASAYLDSYNSTISSTTAIAAKVLGPISAQLSYAVQYEGQPPVGRKTTDTIGRASLVYAF
jgi:putative salt-induced outer membrane protein